MPEPAAITRAPTVRSILINWANSQDQWVRAIVAEILQSRRTLPPERVPAFLSVLLREKGLEEGEALQVGKLKSDTEESSPEQTLTLTSLSEVMDVNALAPDQRIDFSPNITVLFGETGTGKTGYVRILKRLASARTAEVVLPNIVEAGEHIPRATIEYAVNGQPQPSLAWRNASGVSPFTSIDIFDSRAVTVHVDPELMYVYTPGELALFQHVDRAIEAVGARLSEEQKRKAEPKTNPFVVRFSRESRLYPKIETLGASTELRELETPAVVPPEEEATLESRRQKVAALRSNTLRDRQQLLQTDLEQYARALSVVDAFCSLNAETYAARLAALELARTKHRQSTQDALSGRGIPGVLEDPWKEFVEAAEAYITHTHGNGYPEEESQCIYCRQDLGESAKALVRAYREYCSPKSRKEVSSTETSVDDLTSAFRGIDLAGLERSVGDAIRRHASSGATPASLTTLQEIAPKLIDAQVALRARKPIEDATLWSTCGDLKGKLTAAIEFLNAQILELQTQSVDREKALAKEATELLELESRLILRTQMPEIVRYVERQKWANKASALLRPFQGLHRGLTEASKLASEDLLNHDFERLFLEECKNLRAPAVQLEFPGRKGQAVRRKLLPTEHKLSDVLSEGEQKVIALADFLAEACLRKSASPVVLDDPVTSLDYKRMDHVIERVVKLSSERQVIIFTHNIWFTMDLLARFEKQPAKCSYYEIEATEAGKGIVTKGLHPRVDTVKDLKRRINLIIEEAAKASGSVREALVEKGYSLLRSYCEKTVEDELFKGVTQRYRPNVRMTMLSEVPHEKMGAAIAVITPLFDKSCRITEAHSQPLEVLSVRPTLEDLKADWKSLQEAREKYI